MGFTDLSPDHLIKELFHHPGTDVLQEVGKRLGNPDTHFETHNALAKVFGQSTRPIPPTWSNCIGEQKCHPNEILKPTCLDDLLGAVKTAQKNNLTLRAVGSGHSFSDVAPTDGILLDPHGMDKVLSVDTTVLKDASTAKNLFSVQSGITIHDLNNELDKKGVALANMGAYDGQTLAGAISTGTHGTGIEFGPIASSVRALVLVTSKGDVYQIEPSNGITDPAKYAASETAKSIKLKQDDDWFNTTVVSMGCTGIIYSYIIEVVSAFRIQEHREKKTWEQLSGGLKLGASSPILAQYRGYEIDMCPYVNKNNEHVCIEIKHQDTSLAANGNRGFQNWLGGVVGAIPGAEWFLTTVMNHINSVELPHAIANIIILAISALETPAKFPNGYIDKSFKVLDVGSAVNNLKAYAMELSIPCDEKLVDNITKLLKLLQEQMDKQNFILAGPLNLRFVAESSAYFAPQANRITCMVEMDTLVGINTSKELLSQYVKKQMCTPGSGIRVHWGLDLDTVTKDDVPNMYPDFPKWHAVYQELNADGMWNNKFTDRIGISVKK